MKNELGKEFLYCPECGGQDIRNLGDTHRQCEDRDCLQELFTDVDYSNISHKILQQKHRRILKQRTAIETATKCLELLNIGPAKTMAEPWSVWYSEHSGKGLKLIKEILSRPTTTTEPKGVK